jgi:hypothetical protein
MTAEQIINYVLHTPDNTNKNVLTQMLRQLEDEGGSESVFNADTHYDFPSIGNVNVIYKAQSEKMLYQWNPTKLSYESLGTTVEVDIDDIEQINGGNANGNS